MKIFLVYHAHKHRHCPLGYLILKNWHPEWTLTAILFGYPAPFYRGGLIALAPHPCMQVSLVVLKILAVFFSRYAIGTCCRILACLAVGLVKKVNIYQMRQRREYPIRMLSRLLCNLMKLR